MRPSIVRIPRANQVHALADFQIIRLIAQILSHYLRQNLQSVSSEVSALCRAERRRRDGEDATEREELLNAHVRGTDGWNMNVVLILTAHLYIKSGKKILSLDFIIID